MRQTAKQLFVAVGQQGLRISSADGLTWQHAQEGKEGEVYRGVAFGGGRFVAVGTYGGANLFAATTDGAAWKTSTKDGKYSTRLQGLVYGLDQFLAVGGDPGAVGDSKPVAIFSPDGDAWGDYLQIEGKNILRRVAFGGGKFVGVGDRGRRSVSEDGKKWQDPPKVKAVDTLIDVAFGGEVFVGVGLHGLRMTSRDGLDWTDRAVGEEGEHLNSIVWTGERFVTVGPGVTFTSTDGKKWERHPNENAPLTIAYGQGVYVGAAWKGRLLHSTDALKWREVHKTEHHLESVACGPIKA